MSKMSLAASVAAALAIAGAAPAMAADLVIEAPMVEAAPMAATSDWYVSLFAGGVWPQTVETTFDTGTTYNVDFDPGYTLGIAIGTHVFDHLRGEVELSAGRVESTNYSTSEGDSGDATGPLSTVYLLGNLWYELDTNSSVKPYIGGGIGAGYATADTFFDGNDYGYGPGGIGFAYQLGVGVTFDVTESVGIDVGYRYKSIVGVDFDDSDGGGTYADGDVNSHVVQAGVTFKF